MVAGDQARQNLVDLLPHLTQVGDRIASLKLGKLLPLDDRRAVVAARYAEYTQKNIAATLGVSQATISADLREAGVISSDKSRGGRPRNAEPRPQRVKPGECTDAWKVLAGASERTLTLTLHSTGDRELVKRLGCAVRAAEARLGAP